MISQCAIGKKRGVTRLGSKDVRDTVRALAGIKALIRELRRRQRIERVYSHLKRNLVYERSNYEVLPDLGKSSPWSRRPTTSGCSRDRPCRPAA